MKGLHKSIQHIHQSDRKENLVKQINKKHKQCGSDIRIYLSKSKVSESTFKYITRVSFGHSARKEMEYYENLHASPEYHPTPQLSPEPKNPQISPIIRKVTTSGGDCPNSALTFMEGSAHLTPMRTPITIYKSTITKHQNHPNPQTPPVRCQLCISELPYHCQEDDYQENTSTNSKVPVTVNRENLVEEIKSAKSPEWGGWGEVGGTTLHHEKICL